MQTVRIQLPTEPLYWGTATETDVERILVNLEGMIRSEFGDRFDLQIERSNTPTGSGIQAEDQEVVEEINDWIAENWTKAL